MSGGLGIYGLWKFGHSDTKKRAGIYLAGTEVEKESCRNDIVRDGMFSFHIYTGNFVRDRTKRGVPNRIFQYFFACCYRECTVAVCLAKKKKEGKLTPTEEKEQQLLRQEYLEAFENGDYEYQGTENGIELGIHSQMIEQLERLGRAFSVIKEQLVEEKERTNELVTDISHQIKTPISAIHMSLELLQDTQTTEAEKQEFLERAQKEVKKLHSLLETLFQLSRLERGMVHLAPEHTSLKETLIRAVNGVYLKANEKHIEIEMEEFQDISVCCDVKWTAEAFANVIENSVKYSPEGSRVKIRVEPYISYISVEVEDQGMGIDKKEYTNIFQRFYRGKEAERTGLEGAGVGLYLVRKILEEQGGNVRVLKSGAWGTTFQMVLPKENEACGYKK